MVRRRVARFSSMTLFEFLFGGRHSSYEMACPIDAKGSANLSSIFRALAAAAFAFANPSCGEMASRTTRSVYESDKPA